MRLFSFRLQHTRRTSVVGFSIRQVPAAGGNPCDDALHQRAIVFAAGGNSLHLSGPAAGIRRSTVLVSTPDVDTVTISKTALASN